MAPVVVAKVWDRGDFHRVQVSPPDLAELRLAVERVFGRDRAPYELRLGGPEVLSGPALDEESWDAAVEKALEGSSDEQGHAVIRIRVDAPAVPEASLVRCDPYTLVDGCVYTGEWMMGEGHATQRHGEGHLVWPDGATYTGQWHSDKMHGKGRLAQPDGSVYEGEWQGGQMHGMGRYHRGGSAYQGTWECGSQRCGTEVWPGGARYEGEYEAKRKHGQGTCWFANGQVYKGEWADNQRQGEGTMWWPDGREVKGTWTANSLNGIGQGYSPHGFYAGEYKDCEKHGHGVFTWMDGRSYDGQWQNGMQHGIGTLTDADGTKRQTEWCEGTRLT